MTSFPVEMIPIFLKHWEEGYQIVYGVKTSSRENRLMYALRSLYYRLIKKYSTVDQIEHFTGFALYDRSFLDVLRNLKDPTPFIRGLVAELGGKRKAVEYEQPRRRAGKTHNNWYSLYDAAMLSFTSYTKIGLRLAREYGVAWLPSDFKKKDGYKRSLELSRALELYRQNYCGCEFSLRK